MPRPPLPRLLFLYAALFAAFGVASPFLPGLLKQGGLASHEIGLVLAAGTAIRLLAGPLGARVADRTGMAPAVLAAFAAAAAVVALGYGPTRGLLPLLALSVAHAAVLAPLVPIADALTLGSSRGADEARVVRYGWVRAAGSAAFIGGVLASGLLVEQQGLGVIVPLNAALLAVAAGAGLLLPRITGRAIRAGTGAEAGAGAGSVRALLGIPAFVRLMAVAALVGGSHALHDGFEVIRWQAAGLTPGQCSLLWASSVAAEVVVFLAAGPALLRRLGPSGAMTLAALAGVMRWGTSAQTAWFPAMALVQPLHGLTFALLHLACMDVIGRVVPAGSAATAQAFYGTVALGATSAAVTLASGPLYNRLGPAAFWAMAALCAAAMPLARGFRNLEQVTDIDGRSRNGPGGR